ncbi:MAG TPA: Trm112 family protein [Allosphingosinicella sp.]
MKPELLAVLVCPLTRTALRYDETAQELVSDEAGLAYPIRDGVPVMLVEEARHVPPLAPHGEEIRPSAP